MNWWQRALIGILLILNALPFTLDLSTRGYAVGFAYAMAGLTVLFSNIPPLRDFTLLDTVRTSAAAACFAGIIFLYNQPVKIWIVILFFVLVCLLFLPWRPRTPQRRAADLASEAIDGLEHSELIDEDESRELHSELSDRLAASGGEDTSL